MADAKWLISDELWAKMEPLLPEHKTNHPLGTALFPKRIGTIFWRYFR
ncbi:hypothetical protein KAM344_40150 [Aeromonas caviae]|nr:hypothetical protein KAM344_40150 [Aeromonas caviae]